jgi:hypothetical protein
MYWLRFATLELAVTSKGGEKADQTLSTPQMSWYFPRGPFISCSSEGLCGLQGHFPDAKHDPVIQIANMVTVQGETRPTVRNVMTLNTCAHIVGAEVMSFDTERDLLLVRPLTPVMSHAAFKQTKERLPH